MTLHLVVVGDGMLDRDVVGSVSRTCPDAPVPIVEGIEERVRPGGAALAAALASTAARRRQVHADVSLVTSLGDDQAATALTALLAQAGVDVVPTPRRGPTLEKTRVRASGQSLVRFDRGDRADAVVPPAPGTLDRIRGADAVLVADYGAGITALPAVRAALRVRRHRRPLVWDPHPLGAEPVPGATVVTPNEDEALRLAPQGAGGNRLGRAVAAGRALLERWQSGAVGVTMGRAGAVLVTGAGAPLVVPAPPASGDSCGAGDCLAAAAVVALLGGAVPSEALAAAVDDAAAFVAAGGAAAWEAPAEPIDLRDPDGGTTSDPVGMAAALDRIARVRRSGGRVVATGGCFDLLHAGHVSVLQAARALGDCLVVCLNSDAGVRRLKGPGRPLQAAHDRAAVLASLGAVDAVVVFDEDTPVEVLRRIRPDVFAKGGDYTAEALPEQAAMREWGGEVVILPYLPGRSTTGLLSQAGAAG